MSYEAQEAKAWSLFLNEDFTIRALSWALSKNGRYPLRLCRKKELLMHVLTATGRGLEATGLSPVRIIGEH